MSLNPDDHKQSQLRLLLEKFPNTHGESCMDMIIDKHLNWTDHVNIIAKQLEGAPTM